ncbi:MULTISPECIES: pilus assembly protein PilP [Legionella]|uniref:Type IV pilus biogenesis protein PilP n=1 Tax=Legionella maceachernii TaxID=466 RepID=A0A0W0W0F7_9GAMM|nr:pilus assembly protein PilP [Legionella maceachernii]KTD26004.1 type IV pilus biogenesis protein PilP [Legionella maceachernii]SJZ50404.1 Pilus assembly protein, PilP [Legionella maceachernii]SUP03750.1 Pilus assembly protein, PilP [Legionella maceachernii]
MKNWIVLFVVLFWLLVGNAAEDALSLSLRESKMEPYLPNKTISKLAILPAFSTANMIEFNPFFERNKSNKVSVRASREKQFPPEMVMEKLRYSGLLKGKSIFWAILSHSNGKTSSIKLGEQIGKTNWRVMKMTNKYLLLEEKIFIAGQSKRKVMTLYLKPGFPDKK